jgi:hypothetical protein
MRHPFERSAGCRQTLQCRRPDAGTLDLTAGYQAPLVLSQVAEPKKR